MLHRNELKTVLGGEGGYGDYGTGTGPCAYITGSGDVAIAMDMNIAGQIASNTGGDYCCWDQCCSTPWTEGWCME